MIKLLSFIAGILLSGVAHAASTSADLTIQIVPTGSGVACAVGPNYTGSIPAAVQAAWGSDATCIFNSDFRQSGNFVNNGVTYNWANQASWFGGCGASNPIWWNGHYGTENPDSGGTAPCNHTTIETDNDGGSSVQVLHQWVTVADANGGNSDNSLNSEDPSAFRTGTYFPFGMYFETRVKLPTTTSLDSCNSNFCAVYDIFKYVAHTETGGTPFFEMDMDESFAPNQGAGGGGGPAVNGANLTWYTTSDPRLNFSGYPSYVADQYNTYGVRWNWDGNNTASVCIYLNGTQRFCSSGSGSGPVSAFNDVHELMVEVVGTVGSSQSVTPMTAQRDAYTQYVTVWGCSNWRTTGCPGPVLTSAP